MRHLAVRTLFAAAFLFAGMPSVPASDLAAAPAGASRAAAAVKPGAPQAPGYYLTGKERAFAAFPAAPALNSERDHTDLLITLALQGCRNGDQINEAKNDAKYSDAIQGIDGIVNPAFTTAYPETSKVGQLIKHAGDDMAMIMHALKKQNARPRPFAQHPGLVVPLFTASDFSYPSGHSTGSELQARLLAELFPAHAAAVLAKAKMVADSRVVAGVHYESDIEAGLRLGDLIYSALKANAKFARDLEAAQAELAGK